MTALHRQGQLTRLRCPTADCPDPRQLSAPSPPDGTLRCGGCGTSTSTGQLLRPWAKTTGNLFVAGAMVFALGFQYTDGVIQDGVYAVSALLWVVGIYRVIWQAALLRATRG